MDRQYKLAFAYELKLLVVFGGGHEVSVTGTLVHICAVGRWFLYGQFQEHGVEFSGFVIGVGWEAQISMTTLGKKFFHYFVALCLFCTRNGTGGRSIGGQLQRPDMGLSFFRVSNIKMLVMPRQLTRCSQDWG